jgi:hypothetical protein
MSLLKRQKAYTDHPTGAASLVVRPVYPSIGNIAYGQSQIVLESDMAASEKRKQVIKVCDDMTASHLVRRGCSGRARAVTPGCLSELIPPPLSVATMPNRTLAGSTPGLNIVRRTTREAKSNQWRQIDTCASVETLSTSAARFAASPLFNCTNLMPAVKFDCVV